MSDLLTRFCRKEDRELKTIRQACSALKKEYEKLGSKDDEATFLKQQISDLEARCVRRPKYLSRQLPFTSSANLNAIDELRTAIEESIVACGTCFPMPESYLALNKCMKKIVRDVDANGTNTERVQQTIVDSSELQSSLLMESISGLDDEAGMTAALHVLHDLGEILWFDSGSDLLSKTVFLSPRFAIDFIRQVINHNLIDETFMMSRVRPALHPLYIKVREEGCVEHDLLMRLELWRELDDGEDQVLKLKLLLFEFQLVYPSGVDGMTADSDLIVPLYWKAKSTTERQSRLTVDTNWSHRVCWEYEFQEYLPEDLFDKLGAQSYSAYYSAEREYAPDSFKNRIIDKYETVIRKEDAGAVEEWECDTVTLFIDVGASSESMAWQQLAW